MPTTYEQASSAVRGMLDDLLLTDFPDVTGADVSFGLMMASNPDGPAVKIHGVAAGAKIKINSLAHRVEGLEDCTITIDAKQWKDATREERKAMLFHELYHVVPRLKDGELQTDDAGRPKIKLREHDFETWGFFAVVEKYGDASADRKNVVGIVREFKQRSLWDAWADEPAPLAGTTVEVDTRDGDTVSFSGEDFAKIGEVGKRLRSREAS